MEFKGTKGMRVEMHPRLIDVYQVSRPGFHYDPKMSERKANEKIFQHSFELLEMVKLLVERLEENGFEKFNSVKRAKELIKQATEL